MTTCIDNLLQSMNGEAYVRKRSEYMSRYYVSVLLDEVRKSSTVHSQNCHSAVYLTSLIKAVLYRDTSIIPGSYERECVLGETSGSRKCRYILSLSVSREKHVAQHVQAAVHTVCD